MTYTGEEIGTELDVDGVNSDSEHIFFYKHPTIPEPAVPIFDEEESAVIGFIFAPYDDQSEDQVLGSYLIYDLSGNVVERKDDFGRIYNSEGTIIDDGLDRGEAVPISTLDMALVISGVGALWRLVFSGGRTLVLRGGRLLHNGIAIGVGASIVSQSALTGLRVAFRVMASRQVFLFTTTTAARMANRARHVPIHILYQAVRHGRKSPDPQGVAGAFQYILPIGTISSRTGQLTNRTLKIVMRDRDFTILHFHFF